MGTLANAFALLADQQGNEASTIVALETEEVKKIVEEKKKAEAKNKNKKKKSSVRDGGRGKEGLGHAQKSLDGKGRQRNERSDGSGNPYGGGDGPVYMSYWKAKGNTKDGQANQDYKAVKKEMALKTLKEYEQQKANEKQKAEKATLSVIETPAVREATLDNIYTKQKSEDETVKNNSNIVKYGKSKDKTVKKDSNIVKYWKNHKTMNIDEFLKLPTGREGQDGPGRSMGEDFRKNTNGNLAGYSKNRATDNQEYALPDENITVMVKTGPAPDLSETSFPVLGKATNPIQFHWEDSRRDTTF